VAARSAAITPAPPWAPASVTAGIATFPSDGQTVATLLASADARLYHGKRQGGARVIARGPT
jgi:GGDEF domain-containing protein